MALEYFAHAKVPGPDEVAGAVTVAAGLGLFIAGVLRPPASDCGEGRGPGEQAAAALLVQAEVGGAEPF